MTRPMRISYAGPWYQEFGISSYGTVSTIIERTRNEGVNNRRLKRRIKQRKHQLKVSEALTRF